MATNEVDDDLRVIWLKQKISLLLLQKKNWSQVELSCPLKPEEDATSLLLSFLDEERKDGVLFFFCPPVAVEEDPDDGTPDPTKDPPTAMSSFQWESSERDEDLSDEEEPPPSLRVIVHFIEGLPPLAVGIGGVLVRKGVVGPVGTPSGRDDDAQLTLHLQLSSLPRKGIQQVFEQVYAPLMDRLCKQGSTVSLGLLSKGLLRTSDIRCEESPFVDSESHEDSGRALMTPFGTSFPTRQKRKAFVEPLLGEEGEEEPGIRRDPGEFVLRCLTKLREKFTKVPESTTLTQLRDDWETSFVGLSHALAFVFAHPVVAEMAEGGEAARRAKMKREGRPRGPRRAVSDSEEVCHKDAPEDKAPGGEDGGTHGGGLKPEPGREGLLSTKKRPKGRTLARGREKLTPEEDEGETSRKLRASVAWLSGLHAQLSDCRTALHYLHNCFKVIEAGKVEELAGKSVPLLETLEIVWRVGRRNGISGRVELLLEAAVHSLVAVVTRELRPVNLLPASLQELGPLLTSQKKVDIAEAVVSEWESTVSTYGTIIRHSAKRRKDGRHDFDPRKVVGAIQGLKSVCRDLQAIMKELLQVQVVLSSDWSSLVTVSKANVLRNATAQVLKTLTAYDFNIFSSRNRDRWTRQKEDLKRALQEWEQTTRQVLVDSFKNRLTSELVSAVAIVLEKEPCRPIFRELLLSHLPTLMAEFAEEVKGIEEEFLEQCQEDRSGCQAPVAGRVKWMGAYLSRKLSAWSLLKDLYGKHKRDAASMTVVEEVGAEVESVRRKVEMARAEEVKRWVAKVNEDIPRLLVSSVLSRDNKGAGESAPAAWGVKLAGALQTIVWESGQLVQGGFQPPPLALHFSLHYPTLQSAAMRLHVTLKDYSDFLNVLNPIQKEVLSAELKGTERMLEAGQRVVTWSPASLTHFSKSCKGVIDHVTGVTTKLVNLSTRLEDFARMVRTTDLMSLPRAPPGARGTSRPIPSFQEYVDLCEENRATQLTQLQETYGRFVFTLRSASALLRSSRDTAPHALAPHLNSSPEPAQRMASLTSHWRANMQKAIKEMLVGTMTQMQRSLMGLPGQEGLFQVDAELTTTGMLVLATPSRALVVALSASLGRILRSAMVFRHWRVDEFGGAVLDPKLTIDQDSLAASSFYQEISKDPTIHDAIVKTQNCFADVIKEVDSELHKWNAYGHIWEREKEKTVQKFFTKYSTIRQIDDKLRFYKELIENLEDRKQRVLCHSVRLNLEKLIGQITEHAREWTNLIGLRLKETAEERLKTISTKITDVAASLSVEVQDMNTVRDVLLAVRQVRTSYSYFTASLQEIKVLFHILVVYKIEVDETRTAEVEVMTGRVEALHGGGTAALARIRVPHRELERETLARLDRFLRKVDQYERRFYESGPGTVGVDLARGVDLMKLYSAELISLTEEMEGLEEGLDLFDLPEIQCAPLVGISEAMRDLSEVYGIYDQLKNVELSWKALRFSTASLTELESELVDLQVLMDNIREPPGSDITDQLRELLEGHLLSLKVVASLRHSSLQIRHWTYLLDITVGREENECRSFHNGAVLSVWEVLQMGLSRHPEWVAGVVHAAHMEKRVHEEIEQMSEYWRHVQVEVKTDCRVWYLEGILELESTLEHHHLNLKTLESVRFSAPYRGEMSTLSKAMLNVGTLLGKWSQLHANMRILLAPHITSRLDTAGELSAAYRQFLESTRRRPFVAELSLKKSYLDKLASLLRDSEVALAPIEKVLATFRDRCPRLYFLSTLQLASLVAHENPGEYLNEVASEIFNNISSVTTDKEEVVGLESVEGENLVLTRGVRILEGEQVSSGVQEILDRMREATREGFSRTLHLLKEGALRSSILETCLSSQIQSAWTVWWTADVEESFTRIQMGNRGALKEVTRRISEDVRTVLSAMGRLVLEQLEFEEESKSPKTSQNLSESRKTWSASVHLHETTSERGHQSVGGAQCFDGSVQTSQRLQPLLLLLLRCRDVMAELQRQNARTKRCFIWQLQPRYYIDHDGDLVLRTMHKQIKYGFEYRGCGLEDYVLTVANESSLAAILCALATHKPVILQGRNSAEASGRRSMAYYVAHLTGQFLHTVALDSSSSPATLTNRIKGALAGGHLLVLQHPELAPPPALAFLSSILFHLHFVRSHPDSPGILQIGKEDIRTHPSVGLLLVPSSPEECGRHFGGCHAPPLPSALIALCQPVPVVRPSPRDLAHAYLLAHDAPQPHDVGACLWEVARHLESPSGGPLPLYPRHLKTLLHALLPSFTAPQETLSNIVLRTTSRVLEQWLPSEGCDHRAAVSDQLIAAPKRPEDQRVSPRDQQEVEGDMDREIRLVLKARKKVYLKHQVSHVKKMVNELGRSRGGCLVVCGPPSSGKNTVVEVACATYMALDEVAMKSAQEFPVVAHIDEAVPQYEKAGHDGDGEEDDNDCEIGGKRREDKRIFFFYCQIYDDLTLVGTNGSHGILPTLMKWTETCGASKQRLIVLRGPAGGKTIQRVGQPPDRGFQNLTFILETTSLQDIPESVMARSNILHLEADLLSPSDLLLNQESGWGTGGEGGAARGREDEETTVIVDFRDEAELDSKNPSASDDESAPANSGGESGASNRGQKRILKDQKLLSVDHQTTTSSLFHYLLEPFFDCLREQGHTLVPLSPFTLIQQCEVVLEGMRATPSEMPSRRRHLYDFHTSCEERENLHLVLDAVFRTFTSVFKDEFKREVDLVLRTRLENLLMLKSLSEAEKEGITRLLSNGASLTDFFWSSEGGQWRQLKPGGPEVSSGTHSDELADDPSGGRSPANGNDSRANKGPLSPASRPTASPVEEESLIGLLEKRVPCRGDREEEPFVDPVEVELIRLGNSLIPLMKTGQPLLLVGPPNLDKTNLVLKVLKDIEGLNPVAVRLNPFTSPQELERRFLLNLVDRTSLEGVEAPVNTVLVVSNVEKASAMEPILTYLSSVSRHGGLYHPDLSHRWTTVKNLYIVSIGSLPEETMMEEREVWSRATKGFFVHSITTKIHVGEQLLKQRLFAYLEEELVALLAKPTAQFFQALESVVDLKLEIFCSEDLGTAKMDQWCRVLEFLVQSSAPVPNGDAIQSGGVGLNPREVGARWHLALLVEFLWPIVDPKVQKKVLESLKEIVEDISELKFLSEVERLVPVWTRQSGPKYPRGSGPSFLLQVTPTPESGYDVLRQNICWGDGGSPSELDHPGIADAVLKVMSLLIVGKGCHYLPLQLVVAPPISDLFIILENAAKYLEKDFLTCHTAEESLLILEEFFTVDEIPMEPKNDFGRKRLIHISGRFLQSTDLQRAMWEIECGVRRPRNPRDDISILVTATEVDLEDISEVFSTLFEGGTGVLKLSLPLVEEDRNFVKKKLQEADLDPTEINNRQQEITDFLVSVHRSVIELALARRATDLDYENLTLDYTFPLPSVSAITRALRALSACLRQKKKIMNDEILVLEVGMARCQSLESHLEELKSTHADIMAKREQATNSILSLRRDMETEKAKMVCEETRVENLRQELSAAIRSEEELSAEVAEYEEETCKPLLQACNALSTVDIERVKKLVAFSPVTAVQLVFESAVVLLGCSEATWKGVRQATNDSAFCAKLRSLDVAALSEAQVTTVTQKLQQIKISEEHMERMSDIGCALFRFVKAAVFLWRRFHDDILPRRNNVESLHRNTIQLQTRIQEANSSIEKIRQNLLTWSTTLKEEESQVRILTARNRTVEAEEKEVESVILNLRPHIQRWDIRLCQLQEASGHLLKECLLDAAIKSYLAPIPAQMRPLLESHWKDHLGTHGGIHSEENCSPRWFVLGKDHTIVSLLDDLRKEDGTPWLIIKDPHHVRGTYFPDGPGLTLGAEWRERHLAEVIDEGPSTTPALVQGLHVEILRFLNKIRTGGSADTGQEEGIGSPCVYWDPGSRSLPSFAFAVEDNCGTQPCPRCSSRPLLDLSLSIEEMEKSMCRTLAETIGGGRKEGGAGGPRPRDLLLALEDARARSLEAQRTFTHALSQPQPGRNLMDSATLAAITERATALNEITKEEEALEQELGATTEASRRGFQDVSRYGVLFYQALGLLRRVDPRGALHFKAIINALAKAGGEFDAGADGAELTLATLRHFFNDVIVSLLRPRLSSTSRLIFGAVLACLSLPPPQDPLRVIRGFLEPCKEDGAVWNEILRLERETRNLFGATRTKMEDRDWWGTLLAFLDNQRSRAPRSLESTESAERTMETAQERGAGGIKMKSSEDGEEDSSLELSKSSEERAGMLGFDGGHEANKLRFLKIRDICFPLFSDMSESAVQRLLEWTEGASDDLGWLETAPKESLKTNVQKLILARHFRPEFLLRWIKEVITAASLDAILASCEEPLAEVIEQCPIFSLPSLKHQENLVMVHFNPTLRLDLFVRTTAASFGVKQYKITHVSLPSLTDEELRVSVLKSSRRRTWLVINDCHVNADALLRVRRALARLPQGEPPPLVFCTAPTLGEDITSAGELVSSSGVHVSVEGSQNFHLSLKGFQKRAQIYPRTDNSLTQKGYVTFAASSFVHSLICARRNYKENGWIDRVLPAEEDLKSAVELATFYIYDAQLEERDPSSSKIDWGCITSGITEVIYRNVTPHRADLRLIRTMFEGYLSPTLLQSDDDDDEWVQENKEEETKSDFDVVKKMCTASSFSDAAIAEVEGREATFLKLDPTERERNQSDVILKLLECYAASNFMEVPVEVVKAAIVLLISVSEEISLDCIDESERQRDFETLAWENEIKIWHKLCLNIRTHIRQLLKASMGRNLTPSLMMTSVTRLLEQVYLPSSETRPRLRTDAYSHRVVYYQRRNLIPKKEASRFVAAVVATCAQMRDRRDQLQRWGRQETAPAKVNLGVFVERHWWVCQFRRAVCSRAHWPLRGSLVYAFPASGYLANERPPQSVYLTGCYLKGGVWSEGKIRNGKREGQTLTLILTISHSKPVPTSGQMWVPIFDPDCKRHVLMEALMPIEPCCDLARELLYIALRK